MIGISTPSRCESPRSTGAVVSPSTTWPIRAAACLRRLAAGDQLARTPVAAARMPAGDDQVAHPGQAEEGLRSAPAASPSRAISARPRVISAALALSPAPSPSQAPAGERDHVLGRGAQLDADQIVVEVDAEHRRVEEVLEASRERAVLARDDRGPRQPRDDLLRHLRAPRAPPPDGPRRGSRAARRSPGRGPWSG